MLQQDEPDDYVIATGQDAHRCASSCEIAFGHVGLDWHDHVVVDPRFIRPAEVDQLLGDASQGAPACSAGSRGSRSTS